MPSACKSFAGPAWFLTFCESDRILINPYSPVDTLADPSGKDETSYQLVRWPAYGLLVTSVANIVAVSGLTASNVEAIRSPTILGLFLVQISVSVAIVFAARMMLRLRNRPFAYTGATLACIPFLSPFVLLGIPFGVWAMLCMETTVVMKAFK